MISFVNVKMAGRVQFVSPTITATTLHVPTMVHASLIIWVLSVCASRVIVDYTVKLNNIANQRPATCHMFVKKH